MLIYLTTNLINHKVYVGQKTEGRDYYIGGGVKIRSALKSLGRENFNHEVLVECGDDLGIANAWEKFYIKLFNAQDKECGYNIEGGGRSFGRHTEEMKAHMSKVMKGNTNMKKGTKRSPLNIQRCAEAKKRMRGFKQEAIVIEKRIASRKKNGKGSEAKRCLSRDDFEKMIIEFKAGVRICELVKHYPIKQYQLSRIINNPGLYSNWKKPFEPIKN
jgi:group I intron endonuclease